jgi:hypothetical protein
MPVYQAYSGTGPSDPATERYLWFNCATGRWIRTVIFAGNAACPNRYACIGPYPTSSATIGPAWSSCPNSGALSCLAPPPPPPPPDAMAYFVINSGTCTVDPSERNCIRSPNFPSYYGNDEYCSITPTALAIGATLTATSFSTEEGTDVLRIFGPSGSLTSFSGASGPSNYLLGPGLIEWSSDYSVTYPGWRVCSSLFRPPPPPSPSLTLCSGSGCGACSDGPLRLISLLTPGLPSGSITLAYIATTAIAYENDNNEYYYKTTEYVECAACSGVASGGRMYSYQAYNNISVGIGLPLNAYLVFSCSAGRWIRSVVPAGNAACPNQYACTGPYPVSTIIDPAGSSCPNSGAPKCFASSPPPPSPPPPSQCLPLPGESSGTECSSSCSGIGTGNPLNMCGSTYYCCGESGGFRLCRTTSDCPLSSPPPPSLPPPPSPPPPSPSPPPHPRPPPPLPPPPLPPPPLPPPPPPPPPPSPPPSPPPPVPVVGAFATSGKDAQGNNIGPIIGGVCVVLLCLAGLTVLAWKRRRGGGRLLGDVQMREVLAIRLP